jgi:ABC-type phosphate transport system permease subunit
LLASGILGALVQYSASAEGQAIADDLKQLPAKTIVAKRVISLGPWLLVSKIVTPAVFIGIFGALMLALFG